MKIMRKEGSNSPKTRKINERVDIVAGRFVILLNSDVSEKKMQITKNDYSEEWEKI